MQHVPYKGSSAAHPDLLAGRTLMIFDPITAIRAHVKSGSLRGIAVTTAKRSSAMPRAADDRRDRLPGYDAAPGAASSRPPARRRTSSRS